ncbi:pilus assembly FimT family protein [Arabiibacter massiliensis]|uniref:pilus assembly FimT family protein n=1 Tax=Arabiibacter massiliensis TaxID=1870985 RepID=UPI0022789AC5|nr:prepilin-type N-terminal cleavage/methylation domain-containing protein [Arabiibacter massiliensis]
MKLHQHSTKGFTVAELLVAVSIISVLVAVALPTFTSSLASAKESVDLANCRSARAAATTVCLADCSGDFTRKSTAEWVQVALSDGIPQRGQKDPSATLNCTIEENGTRITFFYGEGSGETPGETPGTGGGDTPGTGGDDQPTGGSITVERDGVKHVITSDPWGDVTGTIPRGSVFSDETGVYVFPDQTYADDPSISLAQMGGCLKISDAPRLFNNSDIVNGQWSGEPPKMGDLFESKGSYYVFVYNLGPWDIYPNNYALIDPKYIKTP